MIVSAHTLAVYLLHSGNYLYKYRGFIIDRFEPIMSKLLYLLPNAIAVFVICVFVDALFEWLLKKPYEKLTTVLSSLIIRFFDFIVHLTERILLRKVECERKSNDHKVYNNNKILCVPFFLSLLSV